MSDNRMKYTIDSNMQFPLVEIAWKQASLPISNREAWFTIHRV